MKATYGTRRVYIIREVAPWREWEQDRGEERPTPHVVWFMKDKDEEGKELNSAVKLTVWDHLLQGNAIVSPAKPGLTSAAYRDEFGPQRRNHDADALVVNCGGASKPLYLASDYLEVLPGNYHAELLEGHLTAEMQKFASVGPAQNRDRITGYALTQLGAGTSSPGDPVCSMSKLTVLTDLFPVKTLWD